MIPPERFCTSFDEVGEVVGRRDRGQKGYELRGVNWGSLRKALCVWIPLGQSLVLGDQDTPFLQGQGGHLS